MQALQYTEIRNYLITGKIICSKLFQRITPFCNKILISSKGVSGKGKKKKKMS